MWSQQKFCLVAFGLMVMPMNHRSMACRFKTGVEHKHDYTLCTNFVCKSISAYRNNEHNVLCDIQVVMFRLCRNRHMYHCCAQ